MANQPKKYKKFVATAATATLVASAIVPVASAASLSDIEGNTHEASITSLVDAGIINGYADGTFKPNKELTRSDVVKLLGKFLETKGYEAAANYKTSPAFADLKTTSNEELLKYASVVKEAGVFVGSNGNLLAGDPITRENMAITLVRTVNTVFGISLEEFVASQDFKGDVTDLNQAKAEARTAISVLDFYDITNPAAPVFNPKGNTTRGQFASFLFKTINADYTAAGQEDQEASKVVPTKIELAEKTTQSAFGEKVTITAKVTVAEGESAKDIPVTFTVDAGGDTLLVPQLKEEVKTNAEGVATFTYTRDHRYSTGKALTDDVTAYPTVKPTLKANGIVYWGQALAIKDVTTETVLANGAKKVYQITGAAGSTVAVTFAENLNVAPDKAVTGAKFEGILSRVLTSSDTAVAGVAPFPYEYTTGGKAVALITLDATGKANLVVTGTEAAVTPLVYTPYNNKLSYNERALQAKASTVTFKQTQILGLTLKAQGQQVAATRVNGTTQIGGRDYVATLTTADGKPAVNSTLYVAFKNTTSSALTSLKLFKADGVTEVPSTATGDTVYFQITTDVKGEAKFTVTNDFLDSFATPTVFLDNGTTTPNGKLDTTDLQATDDITYFTSMKVEGYSSNGSVTDPAGKAATNFGPNQTAVFTYQLSDQNGKPRSYGTSTTVSFAVTVTGANPVQIDGTVYQPGQTAWVDRYLTSGLTEVSVNVVGLGKVSAVSVIATPSNPGLALGQYAASATFSAGATTASYEVTTAAQTTLDVATITFSENVTASSISIPTGGASVATNAADSKVLYVTFASGLTIGQTFQVSYKTNVTTFVYRGNGVIERQ